MRKHQHSLHLPVSLLRDGWWLETRDCAHHPIAKVADIAKRPRRIAGNGTAILKFPQRKGIRHVR